MLSVETSLQWKVSHFHGESAKGSEMHYKKSDIFNRVNDCANSSTGFSINLCKYLFMCSSVVTYYGMIFYEVQIYATSTCMTCIICIKFYEIHAPKCHLMVLQPI